MMWLPCLYDLIHDPEYAEEEAEKFASFMEIEHTIEARGITTPEDMEKLFQNVGNASPEYYTAFCKTGASIF